MNERVKQFRVGLVVLLTTIVGGAMVTLNSPEPREWVPWARGTYRITIELPEAPGIGPDTPVRKNGLLIGRVASIDELEDRVAVRADIEKNRTLYPQYTCQVRTTVLGDATIEFMSAPVPPGTPPLGDGAVVQGTVAGSPLEFISSLQGNLQRAADSLARAGDEVAKLAETVNGVFGEDGRDGRMAQLIERTEVAMDNFSRSSQTLEQFFSDVELKQALREGRVTMRDFRRAIDDFHTMAAAVERNLTNLEGLTEPLGQKGDAMAQAVLGNLEGLSRVIEELTVLSTALNNREGSLGKIVHSPELYDNANRVLVNVNHLILRLNDLSCRLRPAVEDVRVFLDKVAREPGRIVGGALNTGPGIK